MHNTFIQLKQIRDLGDTISTYFDFIKKNIKPFLNIFIRYNGIFIILLLGVSYLLVTGFMGTIQERTNRFVTGVPANEEHLLYIGIGFFGFFILFIITAIMNYSLAAAYTTNYQKQKDGTVVKEEIWKMVKNNIGKTLLFLFLLALIYAAVLIVGMVISLIPVLGTFAYYFLMLGFQAWMGLSFMSIFYSKKDVTDGFSEGWKFMTTYFWKSVLVNLVVSLLITILLILVLMIPGILIGIYTFHSLETGVDLSTGAIPKIIWTLALSILLFLFTLNQSMSQFVNSILYLSLHEETYNLTTRENIDLIGDRE